MGCSEIQSRAGGSLKQPQVAAAMVRFGSQKRNGVLQCWHPRGTFVGGRKGRREEQHVVCSGKILRWNWFLLMLVPWGWPLLV